MQPPSHTRWPAKIAHRLRALFLRDRLDQELAEELRFPFRRANRRRHCLRNGSRTSAGQRPEESRRRRTAQRRVPGFPRCALHSRLRAGSPLRLAPYHANACALGRDRYDPRDWNRFGHGRLQPDRRLFHPQHISVVNLWDCRPCLLAVPEDVFVNDPSVPEVPHAKSPTQISEAVGGNSRR